MTPKRSGEFGYLPRCQPNGLRSGFVAEKKSALDCITMSAPLDAIRLLLIGFGKKEPEFGSYAGQLDTGHGVE
jgi:hypothetical protein